MRSSWLSLILLAAASPLLLCSRAADGPGYRSWELPVPSAGTNGFTLLSPEQTGVFFTNLLATSRSITNHVLLNGSGVAAGDVDGDGLVDLYFCGLDGPNRLYRNLGNWRFTDITDAAGVACVGLDATGAAFADIDGDGDLDLIVNSITGGTHVFLNDGKGHFTPAPRSPILNEKHAGTSLALADMDGDGFLDLYIANYRPMFFFLDKPETRYSFHMVNGEPHVTAIDGRPLTDPEFTNRFVFRVHMANGKMTFAKEELGEVDMLYRNDGHGGFTHVPFTGGAFLDEDGRPLTEPPRDWGLSVMFRDLNGDGFPDLYVCNDFRSPDRIWLNDGHGRFRALPRLALRQMSLSSMCVDVADVNRDGFFDIFTADMLSVDHTKRMVQRIDLRPETLLVGQIDNRPQFSRNMLHLGRGDGTFAEIAQFAGLEASDWTWSPIFLDVDLDGFEDLLIANGFERDTMNLDAQNKIEALTRQQRLSPRDKMGLRTLYPRLNTPNLAFRNLGNCRFADFSQAWGFNTAAVSQGMCLADLDNDGDLDVIVNNMNGPAGLYRNNTSAPRLAVRLKGQPPNTRGIGAKIEVFGGPVYQSQEMICGGRYCSSDDPMRTFAVGALTNDLKIVVNWRSGRQSVVEHARGNRLYEIEEPAAPADGKPLTSRQPNGRVKPAFREVSELLQHTHHDEAFDDFSRQPLLPGKLSQLGPGVCWFDLDGDGWEDLLVGTGRGGRLAWFRNNGRGGFSNESDLFGSEVASHDLTALLAWRPHAVPEVLAGLSIYEDPAPSGASVRRYATAGSATTNAKPGTPPPLRFAPPADLFPSPSATGPMAIGRIAGTPALFVGGRVIPGRYPEAASSQLFRRIGDQWQPDLENSKALEKVGLVTGAVFTDLRGSGETDLLLAREWGSLLVLREEAGHLVDVTRQLGLDQFKGWWNGVEVGDFDGDGRLDIAASNWGQNSRYEPFRQRPLSLYSGDFNADGGTVCLEAYFDPRLKKTVPWRRLDEAARAMPFLHARFFTFESYGTASVEEILGDLLPKATVLEANWLESTVFLNRGDHFEPLVLPFEAQLAPAFALCVADFDGDGNEDLFLSQNFFAVQTDMSRYDAGRGLLLRGNGRGQFEAVRGQESGLLVYGEQRGAAACDYDGDGRVDLVVSQNGAATKLFHNETARPGLRVRLNGPDGLSAGTVLRPIYQNRPGPAREVHVGSGYWSQAGAVQVFAASEPPTAVLVRWPGGRSFTAAVPAGAREITIDFPDVVKKTQ